MENETAGDPISGLKWTRKTTEKIARELGNIDINVCPKTVGCILKKIGYSLRVNHKKVSSGSSPDRDEQFNRIASKRHEFAVASIGKWWRYDGRKRYPDSDEMLILADCGGSNGNRPRAWKFYLQRLSNRLNLKITVCHYPPGASKWNPIEHRLFSEVSKNWAGKPLSCFSTITKLISTTTTSTGLKVKAYIDSKEYLKGIKITDEEMSSLNIVAHDILPKLNYTILPT